jgi:hypothetical protein
MAPPNKLIVKEAATKEEVVKKVAEEVIKETKHGITKDELGDLLKIILPATIMAMEQAKNQNAGEASIKSIKAKNALTEKCHICHQVVGDGKTRGCGGPWARDKNGTFLLDESGSRIEKIEQFHDLMVVYPNDPIAVGQFDGVAINGAHYRSSGPNHKVWVPKHNDIAQTLLKFEEDQRIQQIGRKHMRQSGSIGKSGPQVTNPTFS